MRIPSYWRTVKFLKKSSGDVVIKILIMLLITVTYVGQAISIAQGVAAVFRGTNWGRVLICMLLALFCIASRGILTRINESFTKFMGARIKGKLRDELIEKQKIMQRLSGQILFIIREFPCWIQQSLYYL